MSQPEPDEDDGDFEGEDWEDDEELEEGELNLFANMPWLNERVGSMMEEQLTRYRGPDQCRGCGKTGEALLAKATEERFCDDKCKEQWRLLAEARIAQGLHDLRTRGYD